MQNACVQNNNCWAAFDSVKQVLGAKTTADVVTQASKYGPFIGSGDGKIVTALDTQNMKMNDKLEIFNKISTGTGVGTSKIDGATFVKNAADLTAMNTALTSAGYAIDTAGKFQTTGGNPPLDGKVADSMAKLTTSFFGSTTVAITKATIAKFAAINKVADATATVDATATATTPATGCTATKFLASTGFNAGGTDFGKAFCSDATTKTDPCCVALKQSYTGAAATGTAVDTEICGNSTGASTGVCTAAGSSAVFGLFADLADMQEYCWCTA